VVGRRYGFDVAPHKVDVAPLGVTTVPEEPGPIADMAAQ
jgi:hypothetical protein